MSERESLLASRKSEAEVGTQYVYKTWRTGKKSWACHAKCPSEWARSYGFPSQRDADEWGASALQEFIRNDRAYGRVR